MYPKNSRKTQENQVNYEIKSKFVEIVGSGLNEVCLLEKAIEKAQKQQLDLVKISHGKEYPVCKIMDYAKFKYDSKKRKNEIIKANKKNNEIKEITIHVSISKNDLSVKKNHITRFLEKGNKVRVLIRFRGREIVHKDLGEQILLDIINYTKNVSKIISYPKLEGKAMYLVLAGCVMKK